MILGPHSGASAPPPLLGCTQGLQQSRNPASIVPGLLWRLWVASTDPILYMRGQKPQGHGVWRKESGDWSGVLGGTIHLTRTEECTVAKLMKHPLFLPESLKPFHLQEVFLD